MPPPNTRDDNSFPRSSPTLSWRQPLRRSPCPVPVKPQSLTHGLLCADSLPRVGLRPLLLVAADDLPPAPRPRVPFLPVATETEPQLVTECVCWGMGYGD